MQCVRVVVPALALLLTGVVSAQGADAKKGPAPPSSPVLTKALAKATVHNQRVLAVLAEDGSDFAAALKKDRTLVHAMLYEFEVVQLTGEAATTAAVYWKMPDALNEKPALAVLDADGKVLARLPRREVLSDGSVTGEALLARLQPLFCAPADAEAKLAAGLAEGKKSGRAVFVRFDAPW
jgi:hypothetical protein